MTAKSQKSKGKSMAVHGISNFQACMECGFFYLINHGVDEKLLKNVIDESKKFFSLPLEEKMKLARKENRGYSPLYAENLNPSSNSEGDSKESFYVGPLENISSHSNLNQWPSEEVLPSWRSTMESYYERVLAAGKRLVTLIALALNLDEDFFDKVGALNPPMPFLRLLHYPGELGSSNEEIYGAYAHSDYGMITLLATDGVGGLQVCRDKSKQPLVWEDVHHISGAFVVNIGDMTERWTNCLFRSTLHRVMPTGQERYSMAFFLDPNPDCVVECLQSCCSASTPPRFISCRFPPVRSGDYLQERFRLTYGS
ncbi:2-oxoglutarate-Fe(II) type oxidoreductase hxnY-like isoform X2 [Actinidia eriantha]|uniref:2-oxoglutarate-Fe(II) type oxidoreductase hxnY-like isoform X2 n=1 Tax=Actinidia eriantha TaxID=165200 RepID=UPI002584ED54|nr:2-oxoglutarate-Fe(II) type oxidoreductase hxnY-like isoform X2 [Actinidia eriantha]